MAERLLVVEDEASLARNLVLNLAAEGYQVDHAEDLAAAQRLLAADGDYHLLLVDWTLPDGSGVDLVAELRERGERMPMCMLTARTATEDVVAGLAAGADDYVGKPFSLDELLVRITALLRRAGWGRSASDGGNEAQTLTLDDRVVDLATGRLCKLDGEEIGSLTALELRLLGYLVSRSGEGVDRTDLLREVWGIGDPDRVRTRTVDTFLGRLRKQLERDPRKPRHLLTEHGSGYRFVP